MSAAPAETQSQTGHDRRAPDSSAPERPRNVLHVIAPAAVGGAESVVRLLAAEQRSSGARVSVAAILPDGCASTPFLNALAASAIETHVVRVGARGYIRERRAVAAICDSLSPNVIHSHGYRPDVVDALYLRRRGVPIVTTVHGFTGGNLRNRFYQWLQCSAYRRFDGVVAVSNPLARQLERFVPSDRLHVVPNAYRASVIALSRSEARSALGLPTDAFVIGWVGRLSQEKGADLLLDALAHPDEVTGSVRAAFLGDGPEFDALRRRSAQLRLETRVSWHGRVANAERLLKAFDALVLSSRTEGTPMVILEAMSAGVPIVAARVGGVPDVLAAGTGLLVAPESGRELAAAIRLVVTDRGAAAARARAARARIVAEYGVAPWVARYETVYRGACTPIVPSRD